MIRTIDMTSTEKVFTNGLIFKAPSEKAPDFVRGSLSVKVADFVAFLQEHETNSGWVNIDIKESREGKLYCELNTYKPERPNLAPKDKPSEASKPDDEDVYF